MSARVGAIDIGTNSCLLLVVERAADGSLVAVHERCEITRLGQGVDGRRALDPLAVERTLVVLDEFGRTMTRLGVGRRRAVATAVLRDADNGPTLLAPAEAYLRCPVEVISGQREAQLVLAGVRGALGAFAGRTLLVDVGGGSTELLAIDDDALVELTSLEIGAVRLTERLLADDPPSDAQVAALRAAVRAELQRAPAACFDVARVIGVAGTITTLATVELGLADYDSERVNGHSLARAAIASQIERFRAVDLEQRRQIVGLEAKRADVITAGALIVDEILARAAVDGLTVCDRGVRWGLAQEAAQDAAGARIEDGAAAARFYVFGYGSLIFHPELPELALETHPATLAGHRRTFNKRSMSRRCARADSFDAFAEARQLCVDDVYSSLVLGTLEQPGAAMVGVLQAYPSAERAQVLAALDRREGYRAECASRFNGYLRTELTATRTDHGSEVSCVVYLSNPDPQQLYRLPPQTSLEQRAKLLINATPRKRRDAADSRGLHYLEGVRADLRAIGIIDADLEALAAAIRGLPGPWVDLVHPPQ